MQKRNISVFFIENLLRTGKIGKIPDIVFVLRRSERASKAALMVQLKKKMGDGSRSD